MNTAFFTPVFKILMILFVLFLKVYPVELELYMADPEVRIAQKIYCQIKDVQRMHKLIAYLDDIKIFEKETNLAEEEIIIADYENLRAGKHHLRVHIVDENDSPLTTITREWTTLHDGAPKVGIDENNAICIDGTPFFPITSFMLDKSKFVNWPYAKPLDIGSCINTLYAEGYYPTHNTSTWRDYVQSGWNSGWYTAGPVRWDGFNSESPRDSDTDRIADYVRTTKDMPGMFAWNWDDEPNTGGSHEYNPATTCREWTQITHSIDTNHPVWNLYYGYDYTHNESEWHHNRMKEYSYLYNENIFGEKTAIADIISLDYYPYEYKTWNDWISLEDYVLVLDRVREWNYDLFPIATCIEPQDLHDPNAEGHASPCGWPLRNGRGWTPDPTPEQLRNLIWASIIHGVKSIQLFHWFCPVPYENMTVLLQEKQTIEHLTPVLLGSENDSLHINMEKLDGGRIDFMAKTFNEEVYVFAANLKTQSDLARFNYEKLSPDMKIEVYNEDRLIIPHQGYFEDHFSDLDVHIYIVHDTAMTKDPQKKK